MNEQSERLKSKELVVWKKHLRYAGYDSQWTWFYSQIVPKHLTLSEYILNKIKYRKK